MNLTGYYVLNARIHGPRRNAEFWIEGDRIRSAEDPDGTYAIRNGRVVGPDGPTEFRIDASGHITGPHAHLPWLREEDAEADVKDDALGG